MVVSDRSFVGSFSACESVGAVISSRGGAVAGEARRVVQLLASFVTVSSGTVLYAQRAFGWVDMERRRTISLGNCFRRSIVHWPSSLVGGSGRLGPARR